MRDAPAVSLAMQQDDWARRADSDAGIRQKQVRILSEYKINGYEYLRRKPASRSRIRRSTRKRHDHPEEIAELIDYAARYHVEIIPQQQTFGHLHYVLRQERYADLGESSGSQILSPTEPGRRTIYRRLPGRDRADVHVRIHSYRLRRDVRADAAAKQRVGGRVVARRRLPGTSEKVAALPALKDKKLLFWERSPSNIPRNSICCRRT